MRHLMLLRHAKSNWYSNAKTDHERPLNKRGKRDADALGRYCQQELFNQIKLPEFVVCSTAERTRQTWSRVNHYLQITENRTLYDDQLYGISTLDLLSYIQLNLNVHESLLFVGHNPSLEQTLLNLVPDAPQQANGKTFTTANLAIIEIQENSSILSKDTSHLHALIRPKAMT